MQVSIFCLKEQMCGAIGATEIEVQISPVARHRQLF